MKQCKAFITLKGRAVLSAVNAGLLPKIDGGWDDTAFIRFWESFEPELRKEINKEIDQATMVLYQQREQRADDRSKKRFKKLEPTIGFLFGLFLGVLLILLFK